MPAIAAILRIWFAAVLSITQLACYLPETDQAVVAANYAPPPAVPRSIQVQALRISRVFGGGGSGAPYPCDVIELYNALPQAVSFSGWTVQYSVASAERWYSTSLASKTIGGYGYFLVGLACSGTTITPAPDLKGITMLDPVNGKVALVSNGTSITGLTDPDVVDFVGYGSANAYEGSGPAPALSTSTAALRGNGGCNDSDDNAADFAAGPVTPRNSQSPANLCPEAAPVVWSTSPADEASGVARSTNLVVNFSESVTLGDDWFGIQCDLSGTRDPDSATITGGPTSYTVDPNVDFYADDACRLTILGAAVQDSDESDPPDAMTADYVADFRTVAGQCDDPAYSIDGIQGAGASSAAAGQKRTVQGVVTGDFQGTTGLYGYFIQEEASDADTDPRTSEAIFVDESSGTLGDVTAGSRVRVTGTVDELAGMTSLTTATRLLSCGAADIPAPIDLTLPVGSPAEWEQYEGMLVRLGQPLTVADSSELGSRGRLTLVGGAVPRHYTQENPPDPAGYAAWESELARRTLILDDASATVYPDPIRHPPPGLSAVNTVRTGDAIEAGLTGVVDGRSEIGLIQPTLPVAFQPQNPRVTAPVKAAGNVRAVFLSLDDYFNVTSGVGGARGASSAGEFTRQRDKVIRALLDLDAEVIGVSQLENDGFGAESAIADLVNGLNAASAAGTYAFVDSGLGSWGSDAVSVGVIYRAADLAPIGGPAMLDTGAFTQSPAPPAHRPPMAQTFEETTWGERFTVVVNEWHGRADCPATGPDADAGDGQACWNEARTNAAEGLAAWLSSDPTHSGDPDILVLGEMNAFPEEDPVESLTGNGYADMIARYLAPDAMTTLTGARTGYTDHALASQTLQSQVVNVAVWSINAAEPSALGYEMENKSTSQQTSLYAPDPYRSSDQNPVVVDLELLPDQSDLGGAYGAAWHTGQGKWRLGQDWGGVDDGVGRGQGSWNDGQGELNVSVSGPAERYACLYGWLDFSDGVVETGIPDVPDGDWDANENVIAGVAVSPGVDQLVTFPLPTGAVDAGATLNMRVRLIPAPEPLTPSCDQERVTIAAALAPTGRADGGEVEDYAFEPGPLAPALAWFDSRNEGRRVILSWETVDERDVAGFDLYRARSPDGAWERVNVAFIPAHAPGSGTAWSYRYEDVVSEDGVWWHRLIGVDLEGQQAFEGLVQSQITMPTALHLTGFQARPERPAGPLLFLLGVGLAIVCLRRATRSGWPR